MLGHKTCLNKLKGQKLYQAFFSDKNNIKLEINHRENIREKHKYVENKQYATKKPMGQ